MNESLPIHGGQLKALAEQFNISVSQFVDFSANINPEGPPPAVLSALRASLDDLSVLTSYPDLRENDLTQSIARYTGVLSERVVVANGFVPLLDAILRTLPIRSCLLPVPAFVEYRKVLTRAQVGITSLQLPPESSFAYDIDTMIHGKSDAILLANPQNPSGVLCDLETMLRLIRNAAREEHLCSTRRGVYRLCARPIFGDIRRSLSEPDCLPFRHKIPWHTWPASGLCRDEPTNCSRIP